MPALRWARRLCRVAFEPHRFSPQGRQHSCRGSRHPERGGARCTDRRPTIGALRDVPISRIPTTIAIAEPGIRNRNPETRTSIITPEMVRPTPKSPSVLWETAAENPAGPAQECCHMRVDNLSRRYPSATRDLEAGSARRWSRPDRAGTLSSRHGMRRVRLICTLHYELELMRAPAVSVAGRSSCTTPQPIVADRRRNAQEQERPSASSLYGAEGGLL